MPPEEGNFLENLPNTSKKLKIFRTNLDNPESFLPAIEGCNGVIIAHSVDFEDKNDEETKIQRAITGILSILKAFLIQKQLKELYTHQVMLQLVIFIRVQM